jgi:hypothetical protein
MEPFDMIGVAGQLGERSVSGSGIQVMLASNRQSVTYWLVTVLCGTFWVEHYLDSTTGEPASMHVRAQVRWHMNRGCELAAQAVAELFRAATGRAVFADHPLQQRFQDIQTAMAHAYLGPDPLARALGGYLLETSEPELVL